MEPWRLAADVTLGVGLDNQRCMSVRSERQRAFEELFATHYWAVRGYVLRRCRASVADDVLADTFLVAWRRFDSVPDDPLPWLLGVARRLLANQRRHERRRFRLDSRLRSANLVTDSAPEPPVAIGADLAEALARLSEREREALLLVAWEGLEPNRAARVAGCSAAAFRVRLHRARRRLAAALSETSDGPAGRLTEEVL